MASDAGLAIVGFIAILGVVFLLVKIGVFSDDGPACIAETSTQDCAMYEPEP